MTPLLAKEGLGVVAFADDITHHPLPLLPLRRGIIFRAPRDAGSLLRLTDLRRTAGILRCAQDDTSSSLTPSQAVGYLLASARRAD